MRITAVLPLASMVVVENPRVSDGGHREGRLWWRCETPPQTAEDPMTDDRIALVELLQKSCDRDFSEL